MSGPLRLVRDSDPQPDQAERLVSSLDRLIDGDGTPDPRAPRLPHQSPVQVGVLEKFESQIGIAPEISYRLVEVGGKRLVVMMDQDADCAETQAAVGELAAQFRDALERRFQ